MTTPGNDTPGPADGDDRAGTAGPGRKHHRAVLVVASLAAVVIILGLVAVLIGQNREETDPLDGGASHVADFTMHPKGPCTYEPDRGGMVAHFEVTTHDAGRFTVDLAAVTDEGLDNLDIATPHVVRFTVPFYGGQTRKQFDVVVPLTEADYEHGYRKCRWTVNPTGA
jgi:hypothetical protein